MKNVFFILICFYSLFTIEVICLKKNTLESNNDHFNSPNIIDSQLKEQVKLNTDSVSEHKDNVHHAPSGIPDAVDNKSTDVNIKKIHSKNNHSNGIKKDNKNGLQENTQIRFFSSILLYKLKMFTFIDAIQNYIMKNLYIIKIIFSILLSLIVLFFLKKLLFFKHKDQNDKSITNPKTDIQKNRECVVLNGRSKKMPKAINYSELFTSINIDSEKKNNRETEVNFKSIDDFFDHINNMHHFGMIENNVNTEDEKKNVINMNDLYNPPMLESKIQFNNEIIIEENLSENEKIIERMIRNNSVTKTAITNYKVKY